MTSKQGSNFKKCTLWFDGKGKSDQNGTIFVRWSGPGIIVDDVIVNLFTKIKSDNPKAKLPLVITSDRELMVRILKIGGKVMKSGRFYKLHKFLIEGNESDDSAVSMEEDTPAKLPAAPAPVPAENDDDDKTTPMEA